jgi:hypothetical protein
MEMGSLKSSPCLTKITCAGIKSRPYFAFDATHSVVCDMNANGVNDIVFLDNEIPGGKIFVVFLENLGF